MCSIMGSLCLVHVTFLFFSLFFSVPTVGNNKKVWRLLGHQKCLKGRKPYLNFIVWMWFKIDFFFKWELPYFINISSVYNSFHQIYSNIIKSQCITESKITFLTLACLSMLVSIPVLFVVCFNCRWCQLYIYCKSKYGENTILLRLIWL